MENISQMSLLEVALEIMDEHEGAINIYELIAEVLNRKGLADADSTVAAKLYLDITTSSKFVYMGDDNWDLKSRQSLDQFDKDGASFNPKAERIRSTDEDEDEDEDLDESDSDDDDDRDESDSDDEDRDESDSDEDSDESEDEYDSDEDSEESDSDEDEDDDNGFDEEKYNKYMDDYEDQYEN